MSVGVQAARGTLIAFSDSDTLVDRDLLRVLVDELLASDRAGSVFAPALASSAPRTAGDVGYALMLNTWYGAFAAAAAGPHRELPFIMGQLMVFRREVLQRIGGVECADGQLVDDMYLGTRVCAAGWLNVMSARPLRIVTGGLGSLDFFRLLRRWLLFSRSGLPATFKRPAWIRGAIIWVCLVAAGIALAQGWLVTAAFAAVVLAGTCASDVTLHRAFGGARIPLRWTWIGLVVPVIGPFALASLWLDHQVGWRGRDYQLDDQARLGQT
jgi:ceramide glucosyltransferase